MMPDLIYCAEGNKRLAAIALEHGFLYGCRSSKTPEYPPAFVDLDYRKPDFARHLRVVQTYRPRYAVAGDAETPAQLVTVLEQAAALAPYCAGVIVVPKAAGLVECIPPEYVVGLSVPTKFGATQAPYWEYLGRAVHLLGGPPHKQLLLWRYLGRHIRSVDGNSHMMAATRWGKFWEAGHWVGKAVAPPAAGEADDRVYRAFARSCRNIAAAWMAAAGGAAA